MKTYTTVQGDMWDSIAHRQMGSTDYTDILMNANPTQSKLETYLFSAGVTLVIPDIPQKISSKLPPWKKVNR